MRDFVHLHLHTEYSLLDGFARIDRLFSAVKKRGMKAVAVTDHGNMFAAVEFYKRAKAEGVKPIIGCELYLAPGGISEKERDRWHLTLLVKNAAGYKNLCKLSSIGYNEGFYHRPRVDMNLLSEHSEGLVCLSGCKYGPVAQALLSGRLDAAAERAAALRNIFKDDFYLELQNHGLNDERIINRGLVHLAKELGIPVVATNDVHYIDREDAEIHDVLLCIQTKATLAEEDRMRFPNDEFYLKSPDEMEQLFDGLSEALDNTVVIADKCNFDFDFETRHLPRFYDKSKDLREVCRSRFEEKWSAGLISGEREIAHSRMETELDTIYQMGFADYMLIVADFVSEARRRNIGVGPGRGSAGGSIVTYLLDITEVDPLKYDLLFERFLNPERVTMPDVDIDFEDERRTEVIDYVRERYGEDRVSNIITFGTLGPRSAIRDVGRVMSVYMSKVDRLLNEFPSVGNISMAEMLKLNKNLAPLLKEDEELAALYEAASRIEGVPRNVSTHAAGVLITEEPVSDYVPLYRDNLTQFTMNHLQDLGLLKMDFLGLTMITVIKKAVELAEKRTGKSIDPDEQRPEVYDLICKCNTKGLFQIESDLMVNFIRRQQPRNMDDLILTLSINRPGPGNSIDTYLANRNKKSYSYDIPELAQFLDDTGGVIVFQEQVMQIARHLAGYSMGEADLLRDAMSKKKEAVMRRERPRFIKGLESHGISERVADQLFEKLKGFASYAFNKTHAVEYAMIVYRSAYMKTFYPAEFMASLLNSVLSSPTRFARYINECRHMNIRLLPPRINKSDVRFTVEKDPEGGENPAIRWGFNAIKSVGTIFATGVVEARKDEPFIDFVDFLERLPRERLEKSRIEALIFSGCFDDMGHTRTQLIGQVEDLVKKISDRKKLVGDRQINFFSSPAMPRTELLPAEEFSGEQKARLEKEYLGVCFSEHPVEKYAGLAEKVKSPSLLDIMEKADEDKNLAKDIWYTGILYVYEERKHTTKKGEQMIFLACEDQDTEVEVVVFPRQYGLYMMEAQNADDDVFVISGKTQINYNGEINIIANRIISAKTAEERGLDPENLSGYAVGRDDRNVGVASKGGAGRNSKKETLDLVISFTPKEGGLYKEVRELFSEIEKKPAYGGTRGSSYNIIFRMSSSNKEILVYRDFFLSDAELKVLYQLAGSKRINVKKE